MTGLSLAVSAGAWAQSFRDFSQFHLTPTLVNPAQPGLDNDLRVLYGQRQMAIGANSFISHTASLTYPFFGTRNGQNVRTSHVGVTFVSDRSGIGGLLSVNGLLADYSYNLSINEDLRVGLGLQLGFYNRAINTANLRSGAQFNGTTGTYDPSRSFGEPDLKNGENSFTYPVVNAGATFFKEEDSQVRYYVGLAYQNINQPNYAFDGSPRANLPGILVANGGINLLPTESRFAVEPNFRAIYMNSSNGLVNLGSLFKYKFSDEPGYGHVGVGAWYSFNNAAVFSLEMAMPYFFAGYSYDATVNSLASVSPASTHEIIVGYRMNRHKPSPKLDVTPPAPPVVTPKPEIKPEPKPEVKPEVKPEPKPEPKPEVKPEPQVEEPAVKPAPIKKPTKVKKGSKKGAKKGGKVAKSGKGSKYAIDRNNNALAKKFGLTAAELEILNSKPLFNLNDWELQEGTKKQLDDVAEVLKAHPDMKIEVGGHTCTIGTDAQNEIVGNRRADAGADYLVAKGIDASRISKANYTSTLPIADNGTNAGRVKNRRISFKVLE